MKCFHCGAEYTDAYCWKCGKKDTLGIRLLWLGALLVVLWLCAAGIVGVGNSLKGLVYYALWAAVAGGGYYVLNATVRQTNHDLAPHRSAWRAWAIGIVALAGLVAWVLFAGTVGEALARFW